MVPKGVKFYYLNSTEIRIKTCIKMRVSVEKSILSLQIGLDVPLNDS